MKDLKGQVISSLSLGARDNERDSMLTCDGTLAA